MNWLILRGLAREQRHWADFPEIFEKTVSDSKIYALDLPGAGIYNHFKSPLTIDGYMRCLRPRWRRLGWGHKEAWSLLTVSLGGMIGLEWTRRYPQDFERHVVINTSSSDVGKPWERLKLPRLFEFASAAREAEDLFLQERTILKATTNLLGDDLENVARRFGEMRRHHPMKKRNILRQIIAARRYSSPERLKVPTLFLSSAADRLVDPVCSARLVDKYKADHRVHPTAGHDLPMDDGQWVAEQVRDWIKNS